MSEKTNEKAILEALSILCENHKVTASKYLIMAWSIGLEGISSEYIMKGLSVILKERTNPFMPTVGEFRAECKDVKKQEVIAERRVEEIKLLEMENKNRGESISYAEWKRRTFKNGKNEPDSKIAAPGKAKKTKKTD